MYDPLDDSKVKNEYLKMLRTNNIDLVADKVRVINLDCYHNKILQTNSEEINKYLLSMHVGDVVKRKEVHQLK